jgi:hypothetical protein
MIGSMNRGGLLSDVGVDFSFRAGNRQTLYLEQREPLPQRRSLVSTAASWTSEMVARLPRRLAHLSSMRHTPSKSNVMSDFSITVLPYNDPASIVAQP